MERLLPGKFSGPQRAVGSGLVAPVALHHMRSADDKLAHLARRNVVARIVEHHRLGVGNSDADGAGPCVKLLRRQIGAALALGLPVHRIEPHAGEERLQPCDMGRRQRRGGIGDGAQFGEAAGDKVAHLQDERRHGRNDRKDRHALRPQPLEDRLGKCEGLLQHQRCAEPHRHQHLVEAVIEGDRQHVQDDVVGVGSQDRR